MRFEVAKDWTMRLFVTGATGVVGRRAVPLLLSQGHSVTAGVRQTASRVGVAQKELDYVPVDLFDLRELRQAVAGHDAIINLATPLGRECRLSRSPRAGGSGAIADLCCSSQS